MHELSLRDAIMKTEWRQGVVVEGSPMQAVLSYVAESYPWIDDADALVLFSQDCDLLNPSLENEPFAEFFCTKGISEVDASLAYGKNPRKIHLAINTSKSLCISINHRIRIDRSLLAEFPIQKCPVRIPEFALTNLLSWVSKKYSRPAFPDRFNYLLAQIPSLDKKLKKLNDVFKEIKSIFFYLSPDGEIEDDQWYTLRVKVLLAGESFDGYEEEKDLLSGELNHILSVENICVDDISCAFENEMTVHELNIFKVWDKDYISRRYDLAL